MTFQLNKYVIILSKLNTISETTNPDVVVFICKFPMTFKISVLKKHNGLSKFFIPCSYSNYFNNVWEIF
jgi:hypothetical protein